MSEPLPELIDRRGLMRELGVTRASAEAILRALEHRLVRIEGLRKLYVRRSDEVERDEFRAVLSDS